MESNLTTPSRPTNNWAPKSGSPTAHLRGCVEPHFVICLGNAHRPSIRQEYTPHHLASRIHDPGLCNGDPTLSGPVSASGKTIANHKADLGTSCLSVSLTMTINGDPALSGPVSAPHRHFIPSRAGTTRGSWKMVVGMFGQKECWRCWLRSNILYINSDGQPKTVPEKDGAADEKNKKRIFSE